MTEDIKPAKDKKPCPVCGEEIKSVAKKCIHCGELLEARKDRKPCRVCGEEIKPDAKKCTHCGEFIAPREGPRGWLRASWEEFAGDKTLWDVVNLIIVPIALAVIALTFNRLENNRRRYIQLQDSTAQAEIEDRRATAQTGVEETRIAEGREIESARATVQAEVEIDRYQENALQNYYDEMTALLLEKNCVLRNQPRT